MNKNCLFHNDILSFKGMQQLKIIFLQSFSSLDNFFIFLFKPSIIMSKRIKEKARTANRCLVFLNKTVENIYILRVQNDSLLSGANTCVLSWLISIVYIVIFHSGSIPSENKLLKNQTISSNSDLEL